MRAHLRAVAASSVLIGVLAAAGGMAAMRGGVGGRAPAGAGRKAGFELRETKEELKLGYDVRVSDNGGGRTSVTFTLADEGRIKPITSVQVAVPSADKSGYFDVVATLSPFERDGKKVYVLQLTRDLTERGELDLVTQTMDGKRMVMEWAYHRVPLGPALKAARPSQPPAEKKGDPAAAPLPAAPRG